MERLKVLLVGEEVAGARALRLISAAGHQPVAILTSGGEAAPLARAAQELDLPISPPEFVTDPSFVKRLAGERIDLLLNVHSLRLIHPAILAVPSIGGFNLHPGPLPEYAGLNIPSWAIYRGETSHAVTLHWISAEVDAGPIAYSERFAIAPDDTGLSLTGKCVRHGLPLISRLLEDAARDPRAIPAEEQDLSRRSYFGPESPHGGRIQWASPARRLVDLVRASDYRPFESPWGHPASRLGDRRIEIVRASLTGEPTSAKPGAVGQTRGTGVDVAAEDEWVLVERVLLDGEPIEPRHALSAGARLAPDG